MTCQFWTLYSADLEAIKSTTSTKLYLVERFTWLKDFNIDYYVGVDGISVAMIILTAIIIFCGVLASWNVTNRAKEFFALLLILVAGVFGVFVSFDLFVFFVFYEIAVLPMYLLIAVWGTGKKEYSAMKLTIMLMAGSALLLIGLFAVYFESGLQTFDLIKLGSVDYDSALQVWVFPVFFLGFGVLGALFPFHTWSPDGHASAPTAVSMLHAGVLMKLGGYGA
ncbi:MAG: NADH-quinone oxidoreductase subunit M, partial [Halobacteriovoraceae bacterium]|nr:NADH-quinone oxidoreductase subunit M [Halobacteriovoraceae bacterium]